MNGPKIHSDIQVNDQELLRVVDLVGRLAQLVEGGASSTATMDALVARRVAEVQRALLELRLVDAGSWCGRIAGTLNEMGVAVTLGETLGTLHRGVSTAAARALMELVAQVVTPRSRVKLASTGSADGCVVELTIRNCRPDSDCGPGDCHPLELQAMSREERDLHLVLLAPASERLLRMVLVAIDGRQFGIREDDLVEILTGSRQVVSRRDATGAESIVFRGRLIPLVRAVPGQKHELPRMVAVVRRGRGLAAVAVDTVSHSAELLCRPLPPLLAEALPVYDGQALLPSGDIVLCLSTSAVIADAPGTAQRERRQPARGDAPLFLLADLEGDTVAFPAPLVREVVSLRSTLVGIEGRMRTFMSPQIVAPIVGYDLRTGEFGEPPADARAGFVIRVGQCAVVLALCAVRGATHYEGEYLAPLSGAELGGIPVEEGRARVIDPVPLLQLVARRGASLAGIRVRLSLPRPEGLALLQSCLTALGAEVVTAATEGAAVTVHGEGSGVPYAPGDILVSATPPMARDRNLRWCAQTDLLRLFEMLRQAPVVTQEVA